MRRILATALVALATAGGASADTFSLVPTGPAVLPSSAEPNSDGAVAFPLQGSLPPVQPQQLAPGDLEQLWRRAGDAYGIPWQVLAAINKIESNFGRNMGPSSAGAIGWMQFMPDTWARWGTDADGDGVADPWNPTDAVYSAARYLAAAGGTADIARAVFAYNHADWYVNQVLSLAQAYAGGVVTAQGFDELQQGLAEAERAVTAANQAVVEAQAQVDELESEQQAALVREESARLLSDRLLLQRDSSEVEGRLLEAQAVLAARQADLQSAQAQLDAARSGTAGAAFAPGTGALLGAPAYSGSYVFPVGGGPGVVSVGPNHHDYPAADIAAPEGSPVYALSDGIVVNAWHEPDERCGIGFTFQSMDGLTWTYCHLAYLEPSVVDGTTLAAGTAVGLVGETGHAEGPHLHLQLQPPTAYPQDESWFQSFAGSAFSWKSDSQSNPAAGPVFAIVGDAAEQPASDVIYFSA